MRQTTTIGEIAEFINGYAFKPSDWGATGKKIIRIQNLTDNKKAFNLTTKQILPRYIVNSGDILISWSGTLEIFEWKKEESALLNQHIYKVVLSDRVDKEFFKHAIKYAINGMKRYTHGSTMKHIVRGDFLGTKIPLLPMSEQKRISNILSVSEGLMRKRLQSVEILDKMNKSIFVKMFGDPISNPKKLDIVRLDELLDFMTSGSRGWAKYYSEKGKIFIRIQNVGKNELNLDEITYINAPRNAEANRTKVMKGDILLSITADLGRTAVIPDDLGEAYVNQHLAILRVKPNVDPLYLSEYISSAAGKTQIEKLNRGGVKAGLNFSDIKSLKVLLPPLSHQKKFAEAYFHVDNLRKKQLESQNLFERQYQVLMHNYLER